MKTTFNDIAVIGMSCIFPGAKDLAGFWENIIHQKSGIRQAPESRIPSFFFAPDAKRIDRHSVNKGGFVDEFLDFDPIEFGMVPNALQGTEAEHLVCLKLAKTALEDAGIFEKKLSLENAGIIVGKGSFGGRESTKVNDIVEGGENIVRLLKALCPQLDANEITRIKQAYQTQLGTFSPQNIIGVVPNLTASLIANRFNCGGPAYTLDAACASSLLSIESGVRELESGRCDLMLVGAIHLLQCPAMFSFFQTLGALSKQQEVRPFDTQADGILTGEGGGFVVLKRLDQAIADQHRIYAVIKGIGISSDGSHASTMSPSTKGQLKAIDRAWDMTGFKIRDLGYLEAHGTGTVLGDKTELQTLREAFPHHQGSPKAALGAVKALIGHAMAAAGMAGFIKTAMALHKGVIPPTVNCTSPLAEMEDSHFQPVYEALNWHESGLPRLAGVNAFGFGGTNAHVILEHYDNPPEVMTKPEENAVLLYARDSAENLAEAIRNNEADIGQGCCRIALFNPTQQRRELALRVIQKGTEWKGRQDLWFSYEPLLATTEKVTFLFPGLDVPAISSVKLNDAIQLAAYLGVELPDSFSSKNERAIERQLEDIQLLIDLALKKLGIIPDVIAGHSLGEWTASRSIGILTPEMVKTLDRCLSGQEYPPINASFLSINCDIDTLIPLLQHESEIYISNDNCYQQVVVSATQEKAVGFQKKLLASGITSYLLPFGTGYHTPFAETYTKNLKNVLQQFNNVSHPSTPIWSCISAQKFNDVTAPESLEKSIVEFITSPVRFREMIENMYADGARSFIQIGEGSLNGFISNILHKKRFSVISSGSAKKGILAQLKRVIAALFVDGRAANLSALDIANGVTPSLHNNKQMSSKINIDYSPIDFEKIIDPQLIANWNSLGQHNSRNNLTPHSNEILGMLESNITSLHQAQATFLSAVDKPANHWRNAARNDISTVIEFSLSSFPYLIDHCPFRKRSVTDNFDNEQQAIVPFTLFIDLIIEKFVAGFPGLPLTSISSMKVHNFLWLKDNQNLVMNGEWLNENTIKFSIDGVIEALAHTGNKAPVEFISPIINAQILSAPISVTEIYTKGYMFHGPLYQGIQELTHFSSQSLETKIRGISVKGALMDNMGQTLGLLNHFLGNSLRSFPVAVAQIDFYQSPIDQHGIFECKAYLTAEDTDFYYATLELMRNKKPWCKFTGWKTKKSDLDEKGWQLISRTEGQYLSEQLGAGFFILDSNRYKQANSWLIMAEIYLNHSELIEYRNLPIAKQRQFLLTRIAVKDAACDVFLNAHGLLIHPASLHLEVNNQSEFVFAKYKNISVHIATSYDQHCAVAAADDKVSVVTSIIKHNEQHSSIDLAHCVYNCYQTRNSHTSAGTEKIIPINEREFIAGNKRIRAEKYKQYIAGRTI